MKLNKKIGIPVAIIIVVIAGVLIWYFGIRNVVGTKGLVYVEKVSEIIGGDKTGIQNRYAGVVEAQDTVKIAKASDKVVGEVFVTKGQEVKTGDQLFKYDTADLNTKLQQAQLELDKLNNDIADNTDQINTLNAQKATASAEEQADYNSQIQELNLEIKQSQYDKNSKQIEIDGLNESINNAVVVSTADGIVKSVGSPGSSDNLDSDQNSDVSDDAFVTILVSGNYRVKGLVSEQNVYTIEKDAKVIIRSRMDDKQTWEGTISNVDTQSNDENNNNNNDDDYYGSQSGDTSTKYPFYISLPSSEGLLLGQHVYIEMDQGQTSKKKEGLWLMSGYIVQEDESAYVWKADSGKKLVKQKVTLGDYDAELDEYEIKDGLKEDDYIAWPQPKYEEGLSTTTNVSEAGDFSEDITGDEGEYSDFGEGDWSSDSIKDLEGGDMGDKDVDSLEEPSKEGDENIDKESVQDDDTTAVGGEG
ncbi:HlyD family secretion protein [Acetitomaculum ruminis DSM 5522]|uniref:HlyD family secretion protein n=1 Tax=Acetitomaculum ruminis DSM 5522 TaxID=1120918 RepID=A0A1I0Z3X2_9FIRM|nr:efflux RND transporter periplasmic adaptor subunit [Acetitomaculum ruminis]SFB20315.1 HlyD family secretion protein [Acetitomaculum ruminis DSM 5522]